MLLISLLFGLTVAAQSAPQSVVVAPDPEIAVALPVAFRAPDDSEWQDVLEADKSFRFAKRVTVTSGIIGGGAMATGVYFLFLDAFVTMFGDGSSTSNSPDRLAQTGAALVGVGVLAEGIAVVGTVVTFVEGAQLRDAEHRTGYRVSLVPVVAPRTGGFGAMARLEF